MTDALQGRLDAALAPDVDEYDPTFMPIPEGTACNVNGCEHLATEWYLEHPQVLMEPRCGEHGDRRFRVDDDAKANWALHKLRAARRRLAEVDDLYDAELARLTAWRLAERAKLVRQESFFSSHLIGFLMRLRATDKPGRERASHSLPGGKIAVTRSTAVLITDKDALLEWAENTDPKLIIRDIGVAAVKALLVKNKEGLQPKTADGKDVPGIKIEPRLNPRVDT